MNRRIQTSRNQLILLPAVLALGAVLRLYGLGETHIVQDEYFQIFAAEKFNTLGPFLTLIAKNPLHVLLDPLLTHLISRFSGDIGWLRMPSLCWGLIGIVGIWKLGMRAGNLRLAVTTGFLLAISMMHIEWSRRIDFYALLSALSVLHALSFLQLIETHSPWKKYAAWSTVFLYSHPYAVIVAFLHAGFLLLLPRDKYHKKTSQYVLAAWSIAAALFLPWFLYSTASLLSQSFLGLSHLSWNPSWAEFLATLPYYLGQPDAFFHPAADRTTNSWIVGITYLVLFLISLSSLRDKNSPIEILLCHTTVLFGIAAVVALNLLFRFIFIPRQLIWLLPFYLLSVAHGAIVVHDRIRRYPWGLAVSVLASMALFLHFGSVYMPYTSDQLTLGIGFRKIVHSIKQNLRSGDVLSFENNTLAQGFLFHFDRTAFRTPKGTSLTSDGFFTYAFPNKLSAGPLKNPVVVQKNFPTKQPAHIWRFSGLLEDLYVTPPQRKYASHPQ